MRWLRPFEWLVRYVDRRTGFFSKSVTGPKIESLSHEVQDLREILLREREGLERYKARNTVLEEKVLESNILIEKGQRRVDELEKTIGERNRLIDLLKSYKVRKEQETSRDIKERRKKLVRQGYDFGIFVNAFGEIETSSKNTACMLEIDEEKLLFKPYQSFVVSTRDRQRLSPDELDVEEKATFYSLIKKGEDISLMRVDVEVEKHGRRDICYYMYHRKPKLVDAESFSETGESVVLPSRLTKDILENLRERGKVILAREEKPRIYIDCRNCSELTDELKDVLGDLSYNFRENMILFNVYSHDGFLTQLFYHCPSLFNRHYVPAPEEDKGRQKVSILSLFRRAWFASQAR